MSATPTPTAPARRWLAAAGVLLAIALAYSPVGRAGFVWDDDANVTENQPLRSARGLRALWLEPGVTTQYYPLVYTSFWLEYQAWGLRPLGYHVDNVLLHAAASLLLWRVLLLLCLPGAWLAASLFALHPVQVETVAWVTERKNLLAIVFQLLAVLTWLRWVDPATGSQRGWDGRRGGGYLVAFLLYAAALLSKVTSATLGPTLLLLAWWRRGRLRAADVLPVLPLLAAALPIGLLARSLESGLGETLGFEWSPSPLERLLQGSRAVWFYLGKLAWPSALAFNYPRWPIDGGQPLQFVPLLALIGLAGGLVAAIPRVGRGPLVALLFFAGTLAPVLGLLEVYYFRFSYVADHWQYSACIGPLALFAAALSRALGRLPASWRRPFGTVSSVLLIGLLTLLTHQQSRSFESAESLWRDSLAHNPDSLLARYNLGATLHQQGRLYEALEQYRLARQIDPGAAMVWANIGLVHASRGELEQAIASYEQALALDPDRKRLQWNLGLALERTGRFEQALPYLERALEDPDPTPRERLRVTHSHAELGALLLRHDRPQQALRHYQRALVLDPRYRVARLGLADAWLALDEPARAIPHLEAALLERPGDAATRARLERARRIVSGAGPQSSSSTGASACMTRWCTTSTGASPATRIT